jgi:AraC-like DNA-binding protein
VIVHHVSPAGDWETVARPPHPALAPLVRRGYLGYVERAGAPVRRLEVPHDAVVVVVNLGAPLRVDDGAPRSSFVAGLYDRAVVTEHPGDQCGIQLDLTPLGARRLFGLPMRELARRVVDLDAMVPAELVDRLGATGDWAARFAVLDAFLLARLRDAELPRPDVAFAWSRLVQTHGAVGVAQLCDELGCSRRHLAARFGEEVGLAPRAVGRILRFQRVLALLEADGGPGRFADIAVAVGYYDQPHLNRDFRELAGCTPGDYLARMLPGGRGVTG